MRREPLRDLIEIILAYGFILFVIWMPDHVQRMLSPFAFLVTFAIVAIRGSSRDELGLGLRGLLRSLWIIPSAGALSVLCALIASKLGTLHPLYKGDLQHITGYVLWTLYQQFLLNDLFAPRLMRLVGNQWLVAALIGVLFAAAHLPSPWLTLATLVWGYVSYLLFRRYHNLYALGLAQGLLGLTFAICLPDALHHHLRVGLGYLHYRPPSSPP